MTTEKIPAWDAEYLTKRIGELLSTPRMTSIELRLTASLDEVPTLEYEINEYAIVPPKCGRTPEGEVREI